jgi:hypothetical protein
MGNRSNRLTAIQKKNQTSQIFPTRPFPPRASCPAYPGATLEQAEGGQELLGAKGAFLAGTGSLSPFRFSIFDFSFFSDFSISQPLPPARIAHPRADNIYRAPTLQPNGEEDSLPRTCPAPALAGGHTCPGAEGKDGLPWTYPGPTLDLPCSHPPPKPGADGQKRPPRRQGGRRRLPCNYPIPTLELPCTYPVPTLEPPRPRNAHPAAAPG